MKKSTNVRPDFYVAINGLVITAIQTIGEYDHITRREFKTEDEAIKCYNSLGGK